MNVQPVRDAKSHYGTAGPGQNYHLVYDDSRGDEAEGIVCTCEETGWTAVLRWLEAHGPEGTLYEISAV